MKINLEINGRKQVFEIKPYESLLNLLRANGYYGVKKGCGRGECGACVVLVDGLPMNSCLVIAGMVDGRKITTIEGIGDYKKLHPVQEELLKSGGVQCGYCIPGIILSTKALLDENPTPTDEQIKKSLDGHLCRCTGYVKILEGIKNAIKRIQAA